MPQKMKVSNNNEYNQFLEKRGNVFHFIDEAIENWYEISEKVAGGNNIYSDKVVIAIHIIVNLFRIGLRQAVGFIKGYLEGIGKNLQVMSYSQACRRLNKLNLKLCDHRTDKNDMENIEIAIDSTVIHIYSNSTQHNKDNAKIRKYNGRNQARKLHVALDINSKKAITTRYTNFLSHDSVSASEILKEIGDIYKIKSLRADGAYDTANLYKLCNKYNLKPIIKPRKNAKIYNDIDHLSERNKNINIRKAYNLSQWKKKTRYGTRSRIESFFFRVKKTFGFSFKNKSKINRSQEMILKCYLINKFTDIGMPIFEFAS
ncbi:IS5 family transposase [Wolbachia endosymbiont of Anurida maritima]|uniref:IS5 family transposase n=1 Tax=Wolbachia endosymbiont of Anurida maritima TaxID=2850562 RepID=UPI0035CF74D0